MTPSPRFIPNPDQVTPAWLTARLREAGQSATVRSFEAEDIGTGQLGRCIRYRLDLTAGKGPRSVVGKFPSDDPASRKTGVLLRNYLREVMFYRELQQQLGISTPDCYFADIEAEGPHFALLLSDLAPAEQGNQIEGCSEAVARAAVAELAGLHAPSWNDRALLGIEWLGQPTPEAARLNHERYQATMPGFLERYGKDLSEEAKSAVRKYGNAIGNLGGDLPAPFALVHIDYRLDNLLIDERTDPPAITAVDWQSITIGRPLGDVSYFLGGGLEPPLRRQVENDIVQNYWQKLRKAGVEDYSWEDCWNDYRLGSFAGFGVTVIASMLVQETERGNQMFLAMAQRHTQHALDLDALSLLP